LGKLEFILVFSNAEIRVDDLARALPSETFTLIQIPGEKPRTLWVATMEIELSKDISKIVIIRDKIPS